MDRLPPEPKEAHRHIALKILFTLYFTLVFGLPAAAANDFSTYSIFYNLIQYGLIGFGSACLLCRPGFARFLSIPHGRVRKPWLWFVISFAVSAAVFAILMVNDPAGKTSPDTLEQLEQAQTGVYEDWHPVLHTLLAYTIPYAIFRSYTGIVVVQYLAFALALSYLVYTLIKNGAPIWLCILSLLVALLNPLTLYCIPRVWKDCAMAICAMLLVAIYINIVIQGETWLTPIRIVFWAVVAVVCTIIRHNAILFTLPMLLFLMIRYIHGKKRIAALLLIIVLFCGVKFVLYPALKVQKPGYRVTETTGLGFAIMGNTLVNQPKLLTHDTRRLLLKVAPMEQWRSKYKVGNFNAVKYVGINRDFIEKVGRSYIFKATAETLFRSPIYSLQAFCACTGIVWQVSLSFGSIGFAMLLLLAAAVINYAKTHRIKAFLHILPVFVYNLGTALFLMGPNDKRFFLYTLLIFLPLLYLELREERPNDEPAQQTCRSEEVIA